MTLPGSFDSLTALLVCQAIMILAYMVYTLFGFGSALIAVGLMALVSVPVKDVVVLILLVSIPVEVMVLARSYKDVPWRSGFKLLIAIVPFIPLGALVLKFGRPLILLLLLGVALVAFGANFLLKARRGDQPEPRPPRWIQWPAGALAGFLGGLFGTSGPPLVAYLHAAGLPQQQFRLQLFLIFNVMTWVRCISYAATGQITVDRLLGALMLLPGVAIGAFIGSKLTLSLSERRFRQLVSVALILIGLSLVIPHLR